MSHGDTADVLQMAIHQPIHEMPIQKATSGLEIMPTYKLSSPFVRTAIENSVIFCIYQLFWNKF